MAGPHFKRLSCVSAVLIVLGMLSANVAGASSVEKSTSKAAKADEGNSRRLPTAHAFVGHVKWHAAGTTPARHQTSRTTRRPSATLFTHLRPHDVAKASSSTSNAAGRKIVAGGNSDPIAPTPDTQFQGLDDTLNANDPLNYGDDLSAAPSIAVGPSVVLEAVGTAIGVFDKASGGLEFADDMPDFMSASGLGAPCEASNDENYGDPQVFYDSVNDRYIVTMQAFSAVDFEGGPTYECIAASTTGDPINGGWNFYAVPWRCSAAPVRTAATSAPGPTTTPSATAATST